MKKVEILSKLEAAGVIAVVRGKNKDEAIKAINSIIAGGIKGIEVYINKGEQVMDGNTLLQYARFREDKEGDFGRIRRQQQVIKAISQQLKDVTSIFKLPKAVGKLLGSIQTNLPESVLLDCGMDFLKDIC